MWKTITFTSERTMLLIIYKNYIFHNKNTYTYMNLIIYYSINSDILLSPDNIYVAFIIVGTKIISQWRWIST